MAFTHRTFLFHLLYIVCVIFGLTGLVYVGLPQIALHYDHSYLTYLLFAAYGLAELITMRQAWRISNENRIADAVQNWLNQGHGNQNIGQRLRSASVAHGGQVSLFSGKRDLLQLPPSDICEHLALLLIKANNGQPVGQDDLLDIAAERIYDRSLVAEFIAGRIVWVGIFATILGVIMAFWPMIDGVSIDALRGSLGTFFGGIAVAFIPTAVSFLCKILLDCSTRIVAIGVRQLIETIAVVSETDVLPFIQASQGGMCITVEP